MKPEELAARTDEVQIVDVRYPNEWAAGRISGAMHIPLDELGDRLDELDRARPVVTVCRSGARSGEAAQQLAGEGFDAHNLEGGMLAWAEADLPFTTPDGDAGAVAEPEEPSGGPQADPGFQAQLMSLAAEIDDHFGGRQASDEEIRSYLRERMIREGSSPEEADEVLARISNSEASGSD